MSDTYTGNDVQVLNDIQHVRLRTAVYLGNMNEITTNVPMFIKDNFAIEQCTFVPAALRAICEIIDNAVDEFTKAKPKKPLLQITFDPSTKRITVSDNGRGVPIDMHASGRHTPEVVFGSLRSGRNFVAGKEAGVRGMNGVGSSVTNFTSTVFEVTIRRDKQEYTQQFLQGSEIISDPVITKTTSKQTGTQVSFILDPAVYKNTDVPEHLLMSVAQGVALSNPGVVVDYSNTQDSSKNTKFNYPKGFEDVLTRMDKEFFAFRDQTQCLEFFVVPDAHKDLDERIFSWVNSGLLFDGGLCNTQFFNAFVDSAVDACQPLAKKQRCDVTKNDVRQGMMIIGNLKISDPEFDSQAKTRLTGPNLRNEMKSIVADNWSAFSRKNKAWFQMVVDRAAARHHGATAKQAEKTVEKKANKPVPGLLDAVNKQRHLCSLIVTEGLSAASMIEDVRDATLIGSFPLTGKLNNVWGCKPGELLSMTKLTNLLAAMKLMPSRKATRDNLHFGKLLIASDADPDGDAIFSLIVALLYNFWPELFDPKQPYVHRLIAPNICCVKGNKRVHFTRRADYEAVKDKYKGWEIRHLKGLGGMEPEDWNMILTNSDCQRAIVEDGELTKSLNLIFGDDTNARKQWLQGDHDDQ